MRWALVSGDGLPVSGLLTIFRNVVARALECGVLKLPIAADLGYSWRPDKADFFPCGRQDLHYPDWLAVTDSVPFAAERRQLMEELTAIRCAVADADNLGSAARRDLRRRIERLAAPYERHFYQWFAKHDVDWVCAVNMTLSDAVPVTLGLHRAAARRWAGARPGGILFWDHDLFASYSVYDRGVRMYPTQPNDFTPVPSGHRSHRWVVVSQGLADEAMTYPTDLHPVVVPNVLPTIPKRSLLGHHREFLAQHGLDQTRPMLLVPVRIFRVKGVEIAISVLAGLRAACQRAGLPVPYLLVFGSLDEDSDYAREVMAAARSHGVEEEVVFLDGVPLSSYRDGLSRWHLDEVDLLQISRATGGALLFTPNRTDAESVGLGPALAAIADLPCVVTHYDTFEKIYGADFGCIRVATDGSARKAGEELLIWMEARRKGDSRVRAMLDANRRRVLERFPDGPWRRLLYEMAELANDELWQQGRAGTLGVEDGNR